MLTLFDFNQITYLNTYILWIHRFLLSLGNTRERARKKKKKKGKLVSAVAGLIIIIIRNEFVAVYDAKIP